MEGTAKVTGELKQWHKVTLEFQGPEMSETDPDTFRDYRLNVTVTNNQTGEIVIVPGYFAADGNASETGATSGNIWRAHFNPSDVGTYSYEASFRTGNDIAVSTNPSAGEAVSLPSTIDGLGGSFSVAATDKDGADFRGKGQLQYVGEHYMQFAGSGEYFIKAGADSPENFLAYHQFDGTPNKHQYLPHVDDWDSGDPTWQSGEGKGIIGAVNYLGEKGVNSVYFLTMNVKGDGKDVWTWTDDDDRSTFDVSKLAQWEIVFDHMETQGIMMHVLTQETENDQLLNGGDLGIERMLYYRELIARFGHHNAITWNLGEENTNTDAQRKAFSDYFKEIDPYDHLVVAHTFPGSQNSVYTPLLGHPTFDGVSMQDSNPRSDVAKWIEESGDAGRAWVVTWDETGPANRGIDPDTDANFSPSNQDALREKMWGVLTAGGAGVEWYFGYQNPHNDLNLEDFRSRDSVWTWTSAASDFFETYLPLTRMEEADNATPTGGDFVFAELGEIYVIYLPDGGSADLNLNNHDGDFQVQWFDPRSGGNLQTGTVQEVSGGGLVNLGLAPNSRNEDWTILVRKTTSVAETVTIDGREDTVLDIDASPFIQTFTAIDGTSTLLSVEILDLPNTGVLSLNGQAVANGAVISAADLNDLAFMPAADFNGQVDVDWQGYDSNGAAERPGRLLVDIASVNDTPVAVADSGLIAGLGTSDLTDEVLGNDTDVEGGPLTIASAGNAVGGSVSVVNGRVLFEADTAGPASFTYSAKDSQGAVSETVTVDLMVTETPPVPDLLIVSLANTQTDTDIVTLEPNMLVLASDLPANLTTITAIANSEHPDADAIGSVKLQVLNGASKVENVEPFALFGDSGGDYSGGTTFNAGIHTVTLTAYSGQNASGTVLDTITQSFTVGAEPDPNHPPIAGDDTASTTEDTPALINTADLLSNDSDPDGGNPTVLSVQNAQNGSVTMNGSTATFTPDVDFHGQGSFTYTIADDDGAQDTAEVTVNVAAVNDTPVAIGDGEFTTKVGEDISIALSELLQNDTDVDGDSLSVMAVGNASNGNVAINNSAVVFTPSVSGPASFEYTITDGTDNDTATVSLIVEEQTPPPPTKEPPIAGDDTMTGIEDQPTPITTSYLLSNDSDPDGGTLRVVSVQEATNGTVAMSGDTITFMPDTDHTGEGRFTYTIVDDEGDQATATVNIIVIAVNDAPVANDDDGFTATVGQEKTIAVSELLENDTDADEDPPFVTSVQAASNGRVALDGDTVTFTPGSPGQASFTYTLSDGIAEDTASVYLTVEDLPPPPPDTDPITLMASGDRLDGSNGKQAWGEGITIWAHDWNGNPAEITFSERDGFGVDGGRLSQIDHNPSTHESEKLFVEFDSPVTDVSGEFRRMFPSENGGYRETGKWTAYDGDGNKIDEGRLDPIDGATPNATTHLLEIEANQPFSRLVIEATGYENSEQGNGSDSSDFSLKALTYTLAPSAPPEPVVLDATPGALSDDGGRTYWGDVAVVAENWDGTLGAVSAGSQGYGVAGGRINAQIDFSPEDEDGDGVAGDSEKLIFDLPSDSRDISLTLGRMFASDAGISGNAETGYWHGYDSSGVLVDEGVLIIADGEAISASTRKFDLQSAGPIQRLEVSATHYNGDPATASGTDSSDFTVVQLIYTPDDSALLT